MTLANFNSNFNWQLKVLQQAVDCCGIIPNLPPSTPCYCYEVTLISGTCTVEYIDCAGVFQSTPIGGGDPSVIYVCAQEGTVNAVCLAPLNSAVVTGGTVVCTDTSDCQPIETYFYAKVHDPYCTGFGSLFATWTLNGLPVDFGWNTLMTAPPYGTTGNAVNYPDPLSGCGPGGFNDYYFWTLMPAGTLSLPSLVGNDSNNLPVSYPMLGPISQTKCYIGTITTAPGFSAIIGINTAELNTPDGYFYVDLTSPMAATFLQSVISFFYPAPPMNVTITVEGPNQYTIKIEGIYSLGTYIELYMNDYVTVGTLNEVIC